MNERTAVDMTGAQHVIQCAYCNTVFGGPGHKPEICPRCGAQIPEARVRNIQILRSHPTNPSFSER